MRLLAIAALAACHSTAAAPARPSPSPPAITLCRTLEAELRAALGEPTRDGYIHADRVLSWIVGEGRSGTIQYLAVMLDGNGVVVDRVWNVPTEIPWTPTSQCGSAK
jgi:hypothetical protein